MKRRHDWTKRLDGYLREIANKPFDWVSHNCCTMTCDAIKEMTDVDPMAGLRDKYKSKRGAYALIKKISGGDLADIAIQIADTLGVDEIKPTFAKRGDAVLFPTDAGEALGIIDLSGRVIVGIHPEHGVIRVPVTYAIKAWRI